VPASNGIRSRRANGGRRSIRRGPRLTKKTTLRTRGFARPGRARIFSVTRRRPPGGVQRMPATSSTRPSGGGGSTGPQLVHAPQPIPAFHSLYCTSPPERANSSTCPAVSETATGVESSGFGSTRCQPRQPEPPCQWFWCSARSLPRTKTSIMFCWRERTDGAPMITPPWYSQSRQAVPVHAFWTNCPSTPRSQAFTTPGSCELSAGPPVRLPPRLTQRDQPAPGWKLRWCRALSEPRTARSSRLVPRRAIAAGADVLTPPSDFQPDHAPARSTFSWTAPSLPVTKAWIASPYAAAAGPDVVLPPIDAHADHAPPDSWRS
jgi:hypothetical protein